MKATIVKTHCDTETATLTLPSHSEHCITVQASETQGMNRSLREASSDFDATILSQFVFAGSHHYD